MAPPPPSVLVTGTSDPSGGTGLEVDQRVLAIHGCYTMTATTALTAQDTKGVQHLHVAPPAFLRKQLECVINGIGVDVIKIGMLPSKEAIEVVADVLRKRNIGSVVLDSVGRRRTGLP